MKVYIVITEPKNVFNCHHNISPLHDKPKHWFTLYTTRLTVENTKRITFTSQYNVRVKLIC